MEPGSFTTTQPSAPMATRLKKREKTLIHLSTKVQNSFLRHKKRQTQIRVKVIDDFSQVHPVSI